MCDEQLLQDMRARVSMAQAEVTRLGNENQRYLIDLLALRDEMQRLHDAGHALVASLAAVEFTLNDGDYLCPDCQADRRVYNGKHYPDCLVDAALTMASKLGWR